MPRLVRRFSATQTRSFRAFSSVTSIPGTPGPFTEEMRRDVAGDRQQQPPPEVPEDPNFNWALLKLPAETKFPVPCNGIVQRIAADLLARLPTMAARDQHGFVLAVVSDWEDLDDEMRNIVFQRLNVYTIVATYGWPTAIASSSAVQAVPSNYLLPPGVVPVQRQAARNNNARGNGRRNQPRRPQAPAQSPAPAPTPAPAPARGRGRRRQ